MRDFQDTFETRKRSFISAFKIRSFTFKIMDSIGNSAE